MAKNKNQNRQQRERQDQQRNSALDGQGGGSVQTAEESAMPSPQDVAARKQKQRFGHN